MSDSNAAQSQPSHWFEQYMDRLKHHSVRQEAVPGVVYRCPCCGCKTLEERGGYDICPICFWEDDGQDDQDADVVRRGGPNGNISLTQARANFRQFGACDEKSIPHVRAALPEEQ